MPESRPISRRACLTLAPSRFRAIARRSGATVLVRAGVQVAASLNSAALSAAGTWVAAGAAPSASSTTLEASRMASGVMRRAPRREAPRESWPAPNRVEGDAPPAALVARVGEQCDTVEHLRQRLAVDVEREAAVAERGRGEREIEVIPAGEVGEHVAQGRVLKPEPPFGPGEVALHVDALDEGERAGRIEATKVAGGKHWGRDGVDCGDRPHSDLPFRHHDPHALFARIGA